MKTLLFFMGVGLTLNSLAGWKYDSTANTITDGSWVLNVRSVTGGLEIGKSDQSEDGFNAQNQGSGVLNLTDFYADTGFKIVSIKRNALRPANDSTIVLTALIAPDVTSIGDHAFRDRKTLQDVTISPEVDGLGESAFYGCSALTNISPRTFNKITQVKTQLFYGCSALDGELSFPEAISLGSRSFYNTTVLDKISVSSKLEAIYSECLRYSGISVFEPEELPELTVIDAGGMAQMPNLKGNFVFPKLEVLNGFNQSTSIESVTAVNAKSIAANAFKNCSNLKFVDFNPALTNIGTSAFYSCSKLERITAYIPDTCESYFGTAFEYCKSLAMPLRIANQKITKLAAEAFRDTAFLFDGPVEIYSPITSVGDGCFRATKRGQIYRFYGKQAPTTFTAGVFSFAKDVEGVPGNIGAYVHVMKSSAVEGWRALVSTEYTTEQLATLPGYPGKKAIGVTVRNDGSKKNYSWYVDCSPSAGTAITIL